MFLTVKCIRIEDDGKLDTESDSGEFWVLFGGFAPIGKKVISEDDIIPETTPAQLYRYFGLFPCFPEAVFQKDHIFNEDQFIQLNSRNLLWTSI